MCLIVLLLLCKPQDFEQTLQKKMYNIIMSNYPVPVVLNCMFLLYLWYHLSSSNRNKCNDASPFSTNINIFNQLIADFPMCLWGAVLCRCWNRLCYAKATLQYVHQNRPVSGFMFQTYFKQCLAVRLTELKKSWMGE